MKVFKFGGASIKNSYAILNMVKIIKCYKNDPLVIVVSAIGKSTNLLEELLNLSLKNESLQTQLDYFKNYHIEIINELSSKEPLAIKVNKWFERLEELLTSNSKTVYSEYYDSVVSIGELISSTIINYFLNENGINSIWADARQLIKTDNTFQEGKIDWSSTEENIHKYINDKNGVVFLTQGFIGSSTENKTTTLGREGSDFTAAIFASSLNAKSVTIWKDVPGILNADPKIINDAVLFKELPYQEASEMTFYGAKVIHPKTIKPLANKQIPLHVRCFETPELEGTIIHDCVLTSMPPVIIYKENQCLVSFKTKDFSFVNEKGLSIIFDALHQLDMPIHIMQNSAISFSACIDYNSQKMEKLMEVLKAEFTILYNNGLQLVTIKNYTQESLEKYKPKVEHLLEQVSRNNYRVLIHAN
ncbi:MAG: aspartate kinase [Cyclobacteriaceae bacterium]|nr:aspartate kinase [Cyclobacteriaceae bacterium]